MGYTNNAMLIRRELLTRLVKLLNDNALLDKINRIPLEMRPRTPNPIRCCVHKDRAVVKYKIMALLGFNIDDETDELTPLSEYAQLAMERQTIDGKVLTVVDEACSGCIRKNYMVTDMCRGCEARPCTVNCNKDAIKIINGRAIIDHSMCVNCGICLNVCPFHAIAYIPVPCEDNCPVKSIRQNESGVRVINHDTCIHCGKCIVACPFGAVMEKSNIVEIHTAMKAGKKVVALIAPSIAGQFKAPLEQIIGSIKQVGFFDVMEVAKGANLTTLHESHELKERLERGDRFMTTSCCTAYTQLVEKHIPELRPYVSETHTPLFYTAQLARKQFPDAKLVFIGPCISKRKESMDNPLVDYMLNFEELAALLNGKSINVSHAEKVEVDAEVEKSSRGYACSGGVAQSVLGHYQGPDVRELMIDGLNVASIRQLKSYAKGDCSSNFIEVMSCEGGCVNGCGVVANPKVAKRQISQLAQGSN